MKNIKPSSVLSKNLLNEIGNKLSDTTLFNTVVNDIKSYYDEYDKYIKNLELVQPHYGDSDDVVPTFLRSLYSRERADIKRLWEDVMDENQNRIIRCPLCGINRVSQFDHYMPKSIFPEYSVHSNNLIPLCSVCNDKKLQVWLNGIGKRIIFNAYYDSPKYPLFSCDIAISAGNVPIVEVDYFHSEDKWTIHERTISQLDIKNRMESELWDLLLEEIETIKSNYNVDEKPQVYFNRLKSQYQILSQNDSIPETKRLLYEGIVNSFSFEKWILESLI